MPTNGRPKGTTGPRKQKNAVQVMKPRHDRIVLLHLAGFDNTEIAKILEVSEQTVSNVLGDPKAIELIEEGRRRVKENLLEDIDNQVISLAQRSLKNIAKTVDANIKVTHPAKRHQDKVGIDLLKMVGYTGEEKSKTGGLPPEVLDRLTKALERSDNVQKMNIEEVDYEIVESKEKKEA